MDLTTVAVGALLESVVGQLGTDQFVWLLRVDTDLMAHPIISLGIGSSLISYR